MQNSQDFQLSVFMGDGMRMMNAAHCHVLDIGNGLQDEGHGCFMTDGESLATPLLHHPIQSFDALAEGVAKAVDGFGPGCGRVETGWLEGVPLLLVGFGIRADGARPA